MSTSLRRFFAPIQVLAMDRVERVTFLVGGIVVAACHLMLFASAGALWRDEVSSVLLVLAPSWSEMYAGLETDSFPPLWITLLRLWHILGFGAGDDWLRFLGVIMSLGVVAALWWNSKVTTGRLPVLALALVALNPAVFYWGDSVRAYGLAVLLIILLFGSVWQVTQKPTPVRVAAAAVIALLCVQSNYQNSYLILGICSGGAAVCLWRRLYRRAALILAIGFVAGTSLLPLFTYLSRQGGYARPVRVPIHESGFFRELLGAFGSGSPVLLLIWASLILLTLSAPLFFRARSSSEAHSSPEFDRGFFAAVTFFVSALTMVGFMHFVGMPPLAWHFIPIVGLAAVCIEMVAPGYCQKGLSLAPALCALFVGLLSFGPVLRAAETRRTNLDLIAAEISKSAKPGDYVIVNPFYVAHSFAHYYNGVAPQSMLPVLAQNEKAAASTLRKLMEHPQPLQRTIETIENTLKKGNRVWFAGGLAFPPKGTLPPQLPPAPHSAYGWSSPPYVRAWSLQTGHYLHTHAQRIAGLQIAVDQPINPYERFALYVVEGWK